MFRNTFENVGKHSVKVGDNVNLAKLFEMQKALDDRIVREKGLEGQDLLANKILALQVELGELANEWRGFKVWSNDREMRRDKALVEYVDCLHFILSIGLELGITPVAVGIERTTSTLIQFKYCFMYADMLYQQEYYLDMFRAFAGLAEKLGFTGDEIEQAYFAKNVVNHERQDRGY